MLLKQEYWYHKLHYRQSELIVKKTLLQKGIAEPALYGDLVYKFKIIVGNSNFSDQLKKRYKIVGYNIDIMGQSATVCMPGYELNQS